MQLFTEVDLKEIINYWAKDYVSADDNYTIKVIRHSVDTLTGKVLFVIDKVQKESLNE